ncbi:MAG TPA: hypothetical protein VGP16_32390, partial [Asanoa sp.]|nr:hypothetical protein [Asanoa sp.]
PGFPNLFVLNGPGSSGPLSNMVLCAEQQIDWVYRVVAATRERAAIAVDVAVDDAEKWTDLVDETAQATLFTQARSWYTGSNIEGKKERFMPYAGGMGAYVDHLGAEADAGFPTLVFESSNRQNV